MREWEDNNRESISIHYKSMVLHPNEVLKSVFEFIGANWADKLLEFAFTTCHDTNHGDWKAMVSIRINTESVGKGRWLRAFIAEYCAADRTFRHGELQKVTRPVGPVEVYIVRKRQPGEATHYWQAPPCMSTDTAARSSRLATEILQRRRNLPDRPGSVRQWRSPRPVPGGILVCLTGFMPLVLYVTRIVQW